MSPQIRNGLQDCIGWSVFCGNRIFMREQHEPFFTLRQNKCILLSNKLWIGLSLLHFWSPLLYSVNDLYCFCTVIGGKNERTPFIPIDSILVDFGWPKEKPYLIIWNQWSHSNVYDACNVYSVYKGRIRKHSYTFRPFVMWIHCVCVPLPMHIP